MSHSWRARGRRGVKEENTHKPKMWKRKSWAPESHDAEVFRRPGKKIQGCPLRRREGRGRGRWEGQQRVGPTEMTAAVPSAASKAYLTQRGDKQQAHPQERPKEISPCD